MQKNPVISYYRDMDAYDRALKLLSMREHTEKELRKKLSDKGYPKAEIDDAVGKLIAEGSLSEKRFAEAYIRSRLRKSPEGKEMLRLRLREKQAVITICRIPYKKERGERHSSGSPQKRLQEI